MFAEPATGWSATPAPTATLSDSSRSFGIIAMSAAPNGQSTLAVDINSFFSTGSPARVDVFTEPSTGWVSSATPTSQLVPPTGGDNLSDTGALAIATDPGSGLSTVAMGVSDNTTGVLEMEMFQEPAGGWASAPAPNATLSQTGASLAPDAFTPGITDVALESSATAPTETLFAGDPDAPNGGALFVYTEPAGGWATTSTATATLTPAAPTTNVFSFGNHVALDSSTVLTGDHQGDIFAFAQPAGGWSSTSGAAFATVNTNGQSFSGRTYSLAGLCTDVFLGDVFTESVDIVGDPTAGSLSCNPTLKVVLAGTGSGTVTGPQINCGAGCTAQYASGTAITLTATAAAGSVFTGWSGAGCSGTSTCTITLTSDQTVTATFTTAPSSTKPPGVTGKPKPGQTLTCDPGNWTGAPTFGYQWNRDGVALYGFTNQSRKVAQLDEGSTLNCTVMATNPAGSASRDSAKVKVPIPKVKGCPGATGSLTGTRLGRIHLGLTRAQARRDYRHHTNRGKQYEDFFCLTPIGVRVGYASPKLLKTLPKHQRGRISGRVVWASTSNPFYALHGVRVGESIGTASALLHTEAPFHIGLNFWYLAREGGLTAVLKVRGNAVQEVGIADNKLTLGRAAQRHLMLSFE
jgi:hypothetical protein